MSGFRIPEHRRDQLVLWEHYLDDAIPPDHPVRLFDVLMKGGAFAETFAKMESCYNLEEGKPPYHPRDLVALYIYGMMNRIRSSRQLEAACYNRIDVVWLLSGQHPDHATIAGFVSTHQKSLRQIHTDVLRVAAEAGLISLKHVAYDGTKIAADAGKDSLHSKDEIRAQLARVNEEIHHAEQEWFENENREPSLIGEKLWNPNTQSMGQRLASMKKTQERLQNALKNIQRRQEASQHYDEPKAIASTTDPDSRVMPSKEGGRRPNYNAQLGVDADTGIIVAATITDHLEDSGHLVPLVEQTRANCGHLPAAVSADSSYNIGPDLAAMEQMGVIAFMPPSNETGPVQKFQHAQLDRPLKTEEWVSLPKDNRGRITKEAFTYDPRTNTYRCPMGESLKPSQVSRDRRNWGIRIRQFYNCKSCAECPYWKQCCANPITGRTVTRDQYEEYRERLDTRMSSGEGQRQFALRQQTVEPRIGLIKHVMGIRRFHSRGMDAVTTEWALICTAVNIGVLLRNWSKVKTKL